MARDVKQVRDWAFNYGSLRAWIRKHFAPGRIADSTHLFAGALAIDGVVATPQTMNSTAVIPKNYNAVLLGPTVTIGTNGSITVLDGAVLNILENY